GMDLQQLTFGGLTTGLKAAGEATRLRILALLAEAELTVSDLTEILRQSQPRLSRHLRLLTEAGLAARFREGSWAFFSLCQPGSPRQCPPLPEAGLAERFREGSWAFFRLGERGGASDLARLLISRLNMDDAIVARDRERLAAVRAARAAAAQTYFRRHAAQWD